MKKLMFGAAVAAIAVSASAMPEVQVYDVAFSIKTTKAAVAKEKDAVYQYTDQLLYRTQTTRTWKGLLWDCDCPAINGEWRYVTDCDGEEVESIAGGILWDAKIKGNPVVYLGDGADITNWDTILATVPGSHWGWNILNIIEKNCQSCEGLWNIKSYEDVCDNNQLIFNFTGAGFGKISLKDRTQAGDDPACHSYIKSISGNFAGYMYAPAITTDGSSYGCAFCGKGKVDPTCDTAPAFEWCLWDDDCQGCDVPRELADGALDSTDYTAAYGTWSIKYNASASKKLYKKGGSILDAVKVPENVAGYIALAEDAVRYEEPPLPPPTDCEMAEKRVSDIQHEIALLKQGKFDAEALVESTEKDRNDYYTANAGAALASNVVYAAAFEVPGGIPGVETNEFGEIVGSTELVTATKAKNDADAALAELQALKAQGADMTLKYQSDSLVKKFFQYQGKATDATRQQALDALIPLCAADGLYANNIVDAQAKFGRPNAALAFYKKYNAEYGDLDKAYNDAVEAAEKINATYDEDLVKLNAKLGTAEAQRDALCD